MKVKLNGNDFFNVSSPFGSIDSVHSTPHTGLDLAMNIGTHLNSPVDGVITKVVDFGNKSIGKGIYIETDDHQTVLMGHLSSIKARVGEKVSEGDFVALSGSTGHSTGGHLHLALKDADGRFVNPEKLVNGEQAQEAGGVIDNMKNFWHFMGEWKQEGFWHAVYGKSFGEVMGDFFKELGHDIGVFILGNGDLFFLLPAVGIFLGTWIVGRNKYTKLILPLLMAYGITRVFYIGLK